MWLLHRLEICPIMRFVQLLKWLSVVVRPNTVSLKDNIAWSTLLVIIDSIGRVQGWMRVWMSVLTERCVYAYLRNKSPFALRLSLSLFYILFSYFISAYFYTYRLNTVHLTICSQAHSGRATFPSQVQVWQPQIQEMSCKRFSLYQLTSASHYMQQSIHF